jgi:hypothetical protein
MDPRTRPAASGLARTMSSAGSATSALSLLSSQSDRASLIRQRRPRFATLVVEEPVWLRHHTSAVSKFSLHNAIVERLGDLIALATGGFQFFPIQNVDDAPTIGDEFRRLQLPCDDRNRLAANAKHFGQELMG